MRQELLVEVAVSIRFIIENADGSEHPAIRPENGESQVRDHPHPDLGSQLPLIVFQGVSDK